MNPSVDNSIPLLTEVIATHAAEPPAAAAPIPTAPIPPAALAATAVAAAAPVADSIVVAAPLVLPPSAEQLQQIRRDIEEGVMQEMLKQIDSVLHQHLQDHLAVVLDNMADILQTRVRASLEKALAESVTQALAEEMARFENAKR